MNKVSPYSSNDTLNFTVIPLCAESLGVRSMCTYVETPDLKILIDPGVSLGPRYNLLPHPKEYAAIQEARKQLAYYAEEASVVTISHYHYDHVTPTYTDYLWNLSDYNIAQQIYKNKVILGKDHRNIINPSQRRRGWILKNRIGKNAKSFEPADGQVFTFGKTILKFSNPVPHGEHNTIRGWVLMLNIEYNGIVFVHASDVQGPILCSTAEIILQSKPVLVYLGGPPTYLSGYNLRTNIFQNAMKNLSQIVNQVPTVIVDHHILRDRSWSESFENIKSISKKIGHKVLTAAEFRGIENSFLESKRRELYNEYPPSKEFLKWSKLSEAKRMCLPPPV